MNSERKVGAVRVGVEGVADLDRQLADPLDDRFQGADQGEHDLPARLGLELAGAAVGSFA